MGYRLYLIRDRVTVWRMRRRLRKIHQNWPWG